jgi:glycyl-tRNA synthetase
MQASFGEEIPFQAKLGLDREASGFSSTITRRFVIAPSFSIYGGVAGLYDYGPVGCAVKANLLNRWRSHFIIEEDMLEVDCSCVTPEAVLEASGHVAKFQDLMVKEEGTGTCFRADHLLEEHMEKLMEKEKNEDKKKEYAAVVARIDDFSPLELEETMAKYRVLSPEGKPVSAPFPFNLMFAISIGPTGMYKGFLRPETAQSIFTNFKRLLEFQGGKLPFAAAQIGRAFRNEIAPRSGVLRVREFEMCEIEHFVKENEKSHPKFVTVKDIKLPLFPQEQQLGSGKLLSCTLGEAVEHGIIANETLGYFIGRTYLFLTESGVKTDKIRFRQHMKNEMAHYACDCWDAEMLTSYGWIECVGIADRSCFDLSQHSMKSNETLVAYEQYKDGPRVVEALEVEVNKGLVGKALRGDAKLLAPYIESLDEAGKIALKQELESGQAKITAGGKELTLTPEMLTIKKVEKKVSGENFFPHVIEPSFGVGRILYAILEQNFYTREDSAAAAADEKDKSKKGDVKRAVLSLPPHLAPVQCSVLPLLDKDEFNAIIPRIVSSLKAERLSTKVDSTGQAIGRRYARTDEIGIPFGITIDHQTLENDTVTLRERDTTAQLRVPIAELALLIRDLCEGRQAWQALLDSKKYPHHQ